MSQHTTVPTPVRPPLSLARLRRSASLLLIGAAAFTGVAALSLTGAAPAFAHDELVGTSAQVDEATGELSDIELTFSNSIIEVGTEIVATGPDGADVLDGAPTISGPTVTQALLGAGDGDYAIAWRVVSSDGHPIEGTFTVAVADGTAAVTQGSAAEAEHDHSDEEAGADHEHSDTEADHDHAEVTATPISEETGTPAGTVILIAVGGLIVIIGAVVAITVGQRRRARAMGAAASEQAPEQEEGR